MELVREYGDMFQEVPREVWGVMHQIKTTPGQVICENWRRIPQQLQEQIKDELEIMLEKGIIQESQSDWHSPIMVVPKPDRRIRLYIDFRKVNVVAKFDAYLIPRVDKMVENIRQASMWQCTDLLITREVGVQRCESWVMNPFSLPNFTNSSIPYSPSC
ncbi:hypothetical protein Y1Q_0012707 [Alligator mississippiensis]|uniref:Reverse transcriptase domain-containing protein n=1 Tax=Alligator mississippiensis TaxID=8496 RepID=A0A151M8N8_ALLMI|nr:hypothetical protein Y1Q_0012707 [Alligator mississippiensis]